MLSLDFSLVCAITGFVNKQYGMTIVSEAMGEILVGPDEESGLSAISTAFENGAQFSKSFFRSRQFVHLCRPVYTGIVKNLRELIRNQTRHQRMGTDKAPMWRSEVHPNTRA